MPNFTIDRASFRPHCLYDYLNRIPPSRRFERGTQRILKLIWLNGRLAPDFETIADFHKDSGGETTHRCVVAQSGKHR